MTKTINEIQELLNKGIEDLKFSGNPANLYDPINYILSLGGKRLRPALVLMGYQLAGKNPESIVRPALAVEVFHNFTLMHDDIMDQAPVRRGKPTVHEKWNQTVAILSGDTMLVKAYDLLLEYRGDKLATILRRFNQTAVEVCEGQQIDMNFETENAVTESAYINMIRLKTAVLLGYSLELGGMLGGLSPDNVRLLYEIGENMGIGFQLMDDYLDVYGDKAKFGKQVGGDIISNKKTYLLINALDKANANQRMILGGWLNNKSFDPEEKVSAVTQLFNEIGIPELTKDKMNSYFDHSFRLIENINANREAKEVLVGFASQLMARDR